MNLEKAHRALERSAWEDALSDILIALEETEDEALTGRLHGWHAQALHGLGRHGEARSAVRLALATARRLGDPDAETPLRALHARITQALGADRAREHRHQEALRQVQLSLPDLLAAAHDGRARAEVLLERADALFETGHSEKAMEIAKRGLSEAPQNATREQVLLRLCLLRGPIPNPEEVLNQALAMAEEADNLTLISAVARTARAHGLPLPEHTF